jgi:hypothetical protein
MKFDAVVQIDAYILQDDTWSLQYQDADILIPLLTDVCALRPLLGLG